MPESRYFSDFDSTSGQLKAKQDLYHYIAERWASEEHDDMFCHFREGEYRWQSTFISKRPSGYEVTRDGRELGKEVSFGAAATLAGTTPDALQRWIDLAIEAKIYCITYEPFYKPENRRYVEIQLRGSDNGPYGFRYVPDKNSGVFEELNQYAQREAASVDMGKMKHIEGRWFYFELRN